jgi:hypothetical protein
MFDDHGDGVGCRHVAEIALAGIDLPFTGKVWFGEGE